MFPVFVKLKHDKALLKKAFLLALGIQALVGIPAGVGLALVSSELVRALLGDKWLSAIPFIQLMGAINIISAIGASGGYLLLSLGRAQLTAINQWTMIALFLVLALFVFPEGGALKIAILRLCVAVCVLPVLMILIKRELPGLCGREILDSIWRPCAASVLMAVALYGLPSLTGMPWMMQLLLKVSLGALVYVVAVLALWYLSGYPEGAESYLMAKVKLDNRPAWLLHRPPGR